MDSSGGVFLTRRRTGCCGEVFCWPRLDGFVVDRRRAVVLIAFSKLSSLALVGFDVELWASLWCFCWIRLQVEMAFSGGLRWGAATAMDDLNNLGSFGVVSWLVDFKF